MFACGAGGGALAGLAQAQIAWAPCGESNEFACAHLTVAQDPSGATPGVITLAIRRHRAPIGGENDAVVALAGGPGQAALPFAEQFAKLLGPVIDTRDLIVFDQRGTGQSQPLSCHRFEAPAAHGPQGRVIARCADQLGPARAFYTTADTVADIEAIRAAGGYEKLVLYGTSYGTKVAERYAQTYPSDVEALVLDSVVPPNGPDPLNRATFAAIPRILHQLCARRACAQITTSPVADLARVLARIRRAPLHGRWIDGNGHSHRVRISSDELLEILLEGDLEPTLRAELPAAIRSAANGDTAALARLLQRAQSSEGSEGESEAGSLRHAALLRHDLRRAALPVGIARPHRRLAWPKLSGRSTHSLQARSLPSARATCSHLGHPGVRLLAVCVTGAGAGTGAVSGRADADPERRRRPAHADGQRA